MSERLITAKEAAERLGIGAAMLRRYASAYERLSGDEITVHRRDGRLFTEVQLEHLTRARALVMQTSTDVETALKQALQQPVTGAGVVVTQSSALDSAALLQALTDAQRAANEPLLEELRRVRELLEAGSPSGTPQLPTPPTVDPSGSPPEITPTAEGPLVRLARWLERRLRLR